MMFKTPGIMKITLCLWGIFMVILMGFITMPLMAQTNDQMVSMVKNMISQFEEFTAEEFDTDEVINEGASFDSKLPFGDGAFYASLLKEPGELFTLTDYQNGYAIVDEKEVPTNSIDLVFSFITLPGFTNLNAWYDISSLKDAKDENLLLSGREIEKYREYGIIEDEFNYPVPGEFSLRQWLKRELEYGESLAINGTINLEYPSDYQSVVFTKEEEGKLKSIGNTSIKLVDIDRNMLTLIMKGNRREIEGLSILILNTEGKIFTSTSSIAIDANMFDTENKTIKKLSDEEIRASVENFSLSNMETEQVKKIKVPGNVYQIVLMRINSFDHLDTPFSISLPFDD
jgi:hypothetical protein